MVATTKNKSMDIWIGMNYDKCIYSLPIVVLIAEWKSICSFAQRAYVVDIPCDGQYEKLKSKSRIGITCPKLVGNDFNTYTP